MITSWNSLGKTNRLSERRAGFVIGLLNKMKEEKITLEEEAMRKMESYKLAIIVNACQEGGNKKMQEIAEKILAERKIKWSN